MITIETIARLCHEANKSICECAGDGSQMSWEAAEQWQRDSAIKGVQFKLANPLATGEDQHDAWCQDKILMGWTHGPTKDSINKTHPCLVPYDELEFEQRVKDHVFAAIVETLKGELS